MILLKVCFYLITVFSCSNNVDKGNITVIGKAENAKAGATVISKADKKIYYVDGLHYWDEKVIGKIVKVTGKLLMEKEGEQKPGDEVKQQITGTKRMILKPKWELVSGQ